MKYHEETMEAMRQEKELEEQIEKAMRSVGISHLTGDEEKEFKSQVRLGLGTYATDVEVEVAVKGLQSAWLNESETHPGDFDRKVHEVIKRMEMNDRVVGMMAHGEVWDFEREVLNKLEDDEATDEEIEKAVREVEVEWKQHNNQEPMYDLDGCLYHPPGPNS
jgi:tryptophan 2,3-dioxygenase